MQHNVGYNVGYFSLSHCGMPQNADVKAYFPVDME